MLSWQARGARFRGAWSGSVWYGRDDIVTHDGGAHVAKNTSQNRVPTNALYWTVLAERRVPALLH